MATWMDIFCSTHFLLDIASIADIAVWSGLAGTGKRWESLRSSKKYQNLARWFNSILTEYGVLNEVTATYVGKKGPGKPTASKVKEQQGSNANLAKVNGDAADKEKKKVGNRHLR